jgi:hypothetical protein
MLLNAVALKLHEIGMRFSIVLRISQVKEIGNCDI